MIIELVGPAGAGKTSLSKRICEWNGVTLVNEPPYYRRLKDIPFFITNLLLIIPTLIQLRNFNNYRWPTLEPLSWMITLNGWHRELIKRVSKEKPIIVLDEGPLYFMTFLYIYGPQIFSEPKADRWWDKVYKEWADTLDMIIWLDSTDKILVDRIRARVDWHGVKIKSDGDSYKYLDDLRDAYLKFISSIEAKSKDLKIIRFDVGQEALDQIYEKVKAEIELHSPVH